MDESSAARDIKKAQALDQGDRADQPVARGRVLAAGGASRSNPGGSGSSARRRGSTSEMARCGTVEDQRYTLVKGLFMVRRTIRIVLRTDVLELEACADSSITSSEEVR